MPHVCPSMGYTMTFHIISRRQPALYSDKELAWNIYAIHVPNWNHYGKVAGVQQEWRLYLGIVTGIVMISRGDMQALRRCPERSDLVHVKRTFRHIFSARRHVKMMLSPRDTNHVPKPDSAGKQTALGLPLDRSTLFPHVALAYTTPGNWDRWLKPAWGNAFLCQNYLKVDYSVWVHP